MANRNLTGDNPARGWGQLLPEFFGPQATVKNFAQGGRSTRSFLNEGWWTRVLPEIQPGDWVIIQFGHNDQKKDKPKVYADSKTDYREFLEKYITESQAKGACPILATSIYRCSFDEAGQLKDSLGSYPKVAKEVALEMKVPLVDLHEQTGILLQKYGPEKSKAFFLHFAPGELSFYPDGKSDNTHLSVEGARQVALLFIQSLRDQNIPLARWLKSEPAAITAH